MQYTAQEKILKKFEADQQAIIDKMLQVIIRAQRKVDDKKYASILKQIEND